MWQCGFRRQYDLTLSGGVVGVDWWLETTETADGSEGVARVTTLIWYWPFRGRFELFVLP